jgi:hypothetical protein
MKKHYKPKIKNINKLKTYLQDAIKGDNKRGRGSVRSKQCDPKRNNLH